MPGQISPDYSSASSEIYHKEMEVRVLIRGIANDKDPLRLRVNSAPMQAYMSIMPCFVPHMFTCGKKCQQRRQIRPGVRA